MHGRNNNYVHLFRTVHLILTLILYRYINLNQSQIVSNVPVINLILPDTFDRSIFLLEYQRDRMCARSVEFFYEIDDLYTRRI